MFFSVTSKWRADDAVSLDFDTNEKSGLREGIRVFVCGAHLRTLLPRRVHTHTHTRSVPPSPLRSARTPQKDPPPPHTCRFPIFSCLGLARMSVGRKEMHTAAL